MVGTYWDTTTQAFHGFVMSLGQYTTLDFPGATDTWLSGLNHHGQIIGTYEPAGTNGRCGFIYSAGTYTTTPNGCSSASFWLEPEAISDVGDIVGGDSTLSGYLTVNGATQSGMKFPGARHTQLQGLDNDAVPEIVGTYTDSQWHSHGMAFTGNNVNAARSINMPGAVDTYAQGVNGAGQIAGLYLGNRRGPRICG